MKRAVIDLGTNSVLLLIGQARKTGKIDVIQQQYLVTRLGERVFETGELSTAAMERTLAVLHHYAEDIKSHAVEKVHVLGTEALRRAGNMEKFRESIRSQLGWELQVIPAEREALYSFMGALQTVNNLDKKLVVMDVGGGSTEIIVGQGKTVTEFVSLPLGAVGLAEQYQLQEQLSETDQQTLREKIRKQLQQVTFLKNIALEKLLLGTGGTITTLAAVRRNIARYDPERINGYVLHQNEIIEMFQSLNRLTLDQRSKLPSMIHGREDVILYGTLIFLEMMVLTGFNSIMVSDRGLRFGYFTYAEENL